MDGQTDYPDITIKGVSKRVDQLFDSLLNLDKTKECREMYFLQRRGVIDGDTDGWMDRQTDRWSDF